MQHPLERIHRAASGARSHCAKAGQKTPEGFYNIERMLRRVISAGGRVLICGTCMDARGLSEAEMMEGAARSTMDKLAEATLAADKVLVF
ncbi:sulfur relay (sulfurtransferase) complex TusBCD TusD component (DsrE family) [Roseovarius sp. MBR-38]